MLLAFQIFAYLYLWWNITYTPTISTITSISLFTSIYILTLTSIFTMHTSYSGPVSNNAVNISSTSATGITNLKCPKHTYWSLCPSPLSVPLSVLHQVTQIKTWESPASSIWVTLIASPVGTAFRIYPKSFIGYPRNMYDYYASVISKYMYKFQVWPLLIVCTMTTQAQITPISCVHPFCPTPH